MARLKFEDQVASFSPLDRIEKAKTCIEALTYRAMDVIEVNENNKILAFSDRVSAKIASVGAQRAFFAVRDGLLRYEVIKLLSLWDHASENAISIPTAVLLIDSDSVIADLQSEHFSAHSSRAVRRLGQREDEETEAMIAKMLSENQLEFAARQAEKVRLRLGVAIEKSKEIADEASLGPIRNLRDHLAHSLERTRREERASIPRVKYYEIGDLFDGTIQLIEELYLWVNGVSFDIAKDIRDRAREDAEDLWAEIRFN